jgi:hypothetical protein
MFPASVKDDSLKQKEKVFGLRISDANKTWPLKLFEQPTAINDQVDIIPIVLIGYAKMKRCEHIVQKALNFNYQKRVNSQPTIKPDN